LIEAAAKFYVGIFKNSKIGNIRRSDKLGKLNENEMVIWKSGMPVGDGVSRRRLIRQALPLKKH
jgi:hypothetical protein